MNPPHLVPIVELCGAPWTSPDDDRARPRASTRRSGRCRSQSQREIDGFILNRLQGALLAEAFRLVGEGYVSAEDLDNTVKDGLGLRWSFMGPFETIELNAPGGIPDYCARYTGFYKELARGAAGVADVYESPNVDRGRCRLAAAADAGAHRDAHATGATSGSRRWPRTRQRPRQSTGSIDLQKVSKP